MGAKLSDGVYLVILEDHHADVQVTVFSTKSVAMQYFDELVEEYSERYGNCFEGVECEGNEDWVAFLRLSEEGDFVHVGHAPVYDGVGEDE